MRIFKSMAKLALIWLIAISARAAVDLSNKEIWFGPNTNSPGAGTLADPYNTTQFWWIMTGMCTGNSGYQVSTNVTVHLLPDTYTLNWVAGYSTPDLASGIKLIGSGMTNTFIKAAGISNTSVDVHVLLTGGTPSSVQISDLTVDANYQGMTCKKAQGILAVSSDTRIERVRIINCGALGDTNYWTQECFALRASCVTNVGGSILIQDCVVDGPYQGGDYGYVSAICTYGWVTPDGFFDPVNRTNCSVIVRNNTVRNIGKAAGILFAGANTLIEGNHVTGCIQGMNSDTGGGANVSIINNRFENVGIGIDAGVTGNPSQPAYTGMVIADNFVELNDYYVTNNASASSSGVYLPTAIRLGGYVQNALVANNTLEQLPSFRGSTNGTWYWVEVTGLRSDEPNTNITVINNSVGPGMMAYFYSGADVAAVCYEAGNHYLNGEAISLFPNLDYTLADAASSFTIDHSPAAHQFTPAMYVNLTTSSSATAGTKVIHIPDPYYYQGQSFKLYLTKGPTSASVGASLQADSNGWGGTFNNQVITDIATGTKTAVGNAYTVFGASTSAGTKSLTLTSIGGGWMLQK